MVYFSLQAGVDRLRKRRQQLKAGTEAEAMKECYLLACPDYFLVQPRIICLGMAVPTVGTSIINHENSPRDLCASQTDGGVFSLEVSCF